MSDMPDEARAIIDQAMKARPADPPPAGIPAEQVVNREEPTAPQPAPANPQEPTAEQPPGRPEADGPSDEQRVPFKRFEETNKARKAAESALEKQATELATLRSELAEEKRQRELAAIISGENRPKGWSDFSEEAKTVWLAEQVASRSQTTPQPSATDNGDSRDAIAAKWKLMEDESLDVRQAAVVYDIQQEAQGLPLEDVLVLAARRRPELFAAAEGAGSSVDSPQVPSSHSVNAPKSTRTRTAQEPSKSDQHRQRMLESKDPRHQTKSAVEWIASRVTLPEV